MNKLIAFLGILAGALTTFAALLYNPLASATLETGSAGARYSWSALEFHGAELGAAELLGLPVPHRRQPFAEENIRASTASIVVVRNSEGEAAALATRLVSGAPDGRLLAGNVGANVYMTFFLPNRGSLYLTGYENRWPVVRSELLGLVGQPAENRWDVSTRGAPDRVSRIVGGSGGLAGSGGSFRETLEPAPEADGKLSGTVELDLAFR